MQPVGAENDVTAAVGCQNAPVDHSHSHRRGWRRRATNLRLLPGDLTKLIKTVKGIRAAWRDTEDGPVPIEVIGADTPDSVGG